MDAARVLRYARRRAALTQRQLAAKAGIAQPAVADRIRHSESPRVDTFDKLLEACGMGLEVERRLGIGEDRTLPRALLKLSPRERLVEAESDAETLERLSAATVVPRR